MEGEDERPGELSWPSGFAAAPSDRDALLVLMRLASLTPRRLLDLAQEFGTARACLEVVRGGRAGSESDAALARSIDPAHVRAGVERAGARLVTVNDQEYPSELLDLFDPPAALFVRGDAPSALQPRVAIVGARNCSPGGQEIASILGRALGRAGACVVSGAARGIDVAAHRGAMEARSPTVAVLGCGIDIAYPSRHRRVLSDIAKCGAVVSEYPPGTPAEPFRFPARNRLVAALSRAVVVVEGASGSGSMITADHALEIGRDVFAVPGAVSSALAAVPLALIREGATLIRGPEDLLADLGLSEAGPGAQPLGQGGSGEPERSAGGQESGLSETERQVLRALAVPTAPDGLATATGLTVPQVMSALVGLELRRLVREVGGRFERQTGGG